MRIAKMPHVRFDKSKKRYLVAKRVPLDVRAIIGGGEFRYHKFLQRVGQQEANALSVGIVERWQIEWNAALVDEPANGTAPVYPGEQAPTELAAPMKMAEASRVVPWEDLIEPWKKHRHSKGKATPIKAENAMRRVMIRLFAFLAHDDMA